MLLFFSFEAKVIKTPKCTVFAFLICIHVIIVRISITWKRKRKQTIGAYIMVQLAQISILNSFTHLLCV